LMGLNGTLFFAANNGTNGAELWRSDGTAGGTVLFKDINPGSASSSPAGLASVGDILFLRASGSTSGAELWSSDGSAAGTALVKDINPGSASSSPDGFTDLDGNLFFTANDGTNGTELWKAFRVPDTPTLISTDPASPANDNYPKAKGTVGGGDPTGVKLYTNRTCSGAPAATGTVAAFTGTGIGVNVPDDATTALSAKASSTTGESRCSNSITYTEDSTPPGAPTIGGSSPASPANVANPTIFGSAEPGSTVHLYTASDCAASPAATGSASSFSSAGLAVAVADDGSTSVSAAATDAAGNTSPCSARVTYTEDSTAPQTMIESGPSGPTNDKKAAFTFESSESNSTFDCRLDDGDYFPCSPGNEMPALSDGPHTFAVRATDEAGNIDSTPDTRKFTRDTRAPDTRITKGPSGTIHDLVATFEFASSEGGSTFDCKLGDRAFKPCESPKTYRFRKRGRHIVEIRATDAAGNADRVPAHRAFRVRP